MTTQNMTADGSILIGRSKNLRNGKEYVATVHVTGTFGGGALTIQTSVDGGTTKVDTSFTATANKADSLTNLGADNKLDGGVDIYATLSGATSPDLDIDFQDNA